MYKGGRVSTRVSLPIYQGMFEVGREAAQVDVNVPRGCSPGHVLPVRVRNTRLNIEIQPESHPVFSVKGRDLIIHVDLHLPVALAGGKFDITTLDKRILTVNVPRGSASSNNYVLRGEGLRPNDGAPGDLIVKTTTLLPSSLSDEKIKEIVKALEGAQYEEGKGTFAVRLVHFLEKARWVVFARIVLLLVVLYYISKDGLPSIFRMMGMLIMTVLLNSIWKLFSSSDIEVGYSEHK